MVRARGVLTAALVVAAWVTAPGGVRAGNSDDVIAGSDVALTGGAVVANVHTGGAMWFNPAGVARLDSRSVDLTGAVLEYSLVRAPGALSIESGEQSEGDFSAVQAIPRALTFVASPRPVLRWGIGFFFSRSLSRFLQDSVQSADTAVEPAEFYATADETKAFYHVSSAVAWKKSERFLLGGAFDIVVATQRLTEIVAGGYSGGAGGSFTRAFNRSLSGAGLQLKGGLQWAPIEKLRFGWMVATPSYLVYLNEETTETAQLAPPGEPSQFAGGQVDSLRGAWAGVERGLTRVGGAWLDRWGWIELDLIVSFPLQTEELDINWRTTADIRLGGVFRVTDKLKIGTGFFTDFSPQRRIEGFGDETINYYGATVGLDFANREKPPERGEDGFYLAFAVALRYAHGKGDIAGIRFPSTYGDAPGPPGELSLVGVTVNEFGVNVAIKAAF